MKIAHRLLLLEIHYALLSMDHFKSPSVLVFLLVLMFHSVLSQEETQPLSSHTDRLALVWLRSSLGLRAEDWPVKSDPCLIWRGINCRDGSVVGINISGFKRTRLGSQNPQLAVDALASLTNLESFNASFFALPGQIPDWFGSKLSNLRVLDLHSCSVVGAIPSSLGELLSLSIMDLSQNSLTGSIPTSIGNLAHLRRLDISGNMLSSTIPAQIGGLANLAELDLSSNRLEGSLPPEMKGLRSMRRLVVGNNRLVGVLPDDVFLALTHLEFLDLSHNYFEGKVPDYVHLSKSSLNTNCLQNMNKQRTLVECASFYSLKGLKFDDFGIPTETSPRKSHKQAIILAAILAAMILVLLLSLVLLLLLCARKRDSTNQLEDGRGGEIPAPIMGHLVEYLLTSRAWDHHLRSFNRWLFC
ncbi:hypothetical protein Nepgr_015281 [Nepenthes gracilis]|uniref:Leucine-rich repeat-containing N-terminal plant-type domain-containing protein n=1 Tax=Nepenthes gracilis TaxID=150966 RepID=A0AAD3XRD1_NEPGR|nr:hypothetical protein Nepgr_015281 [Nepenthes gracilis]